MKNLVFLCALILFAALPSRAHAAEYTLSGSGVFTCNDTSHTQPGFPVESFSLGGVDPTIVSSNKAAGGKISLSNFTVNRIFDGCSEALMSAFLQGARTSTLVFKAYRPHEGKATVFLTITLTNVYVTSYQIQGSSGGGNPQEAVSFSFARVSIESININPDGSPGATVTVTYDVGTNAVS